MTQYQLLPCRRTAELIKDVFGHRVSEGTLVKINREADRCFTGIRSLLHVVLLVSSVLHGDETGFRLKGKRH
ncbi:IS66 family transposase [Caldifermentibacillus hisashii]|uniref:IS66 family transposase n=1 Tax=Caldifermentibacillus hisashii TaxID=996558 RepID=UPI0037C01EC3